MPDAARSAPEPMIAVAGLVYDYPTARALHGLDFTIAPGTITAMVGPNGAGKTTLLRCLAALDEPTEGHIVVGGIDIVREPRRHRRQTGFLSDFFGVYDALTVRQCLTYFAGAHGVPAERVAGAATWAAERLGLTDRMTHKAGTLSRGLRQRLAIAQVILHGPRLLLLDEPASGLDPEARASLSALLRALAQDGMTLIVSSHILAELEDYSTHMMMISRGRIADYRPIGATIAGARPLRLVLAAPAPGLALALAAFATVREVELLPDGARFLFAGDMPAQAALLRRLIEAGLPVAALAEERTAMQEVYLARLRAEAART